MATDARISTALPSHHKTKKLSRRLGAAGPLGCIYLFLWVATHRSDGDLTGMTDEDIELAIDWTGDDGAFVAAMMDVGFLDGEPGARRVHDWAEHNPWAAGAEARSEKSRWAALCKQHGRAEAARQMPEYAERIGAGPRPHADGEPEAATSKLDAAPESATGTPLAETGTAPSPSPSPSPSPFLPVSFPSPSPLPVATQSPAAPKPRAPKLAATVEAPSASVAVWNAYSDAYELRYGTVPVRNAKVNGQIGQFVARIAAQEAPHVAAFYVGHNAQFYVRDMHSVGLLLRDAEKLRTEWATNRQMTTTKAQQTDKTATNYGAFQGLIEEAEAREQNHAQ